MSRRAATALLLLSIAATTSGAQTRKTLGASPFKIAVAHFDAERLEPAKTAFTPLAVAGNADAMYYLGRIALEQSQPDTAVRWLESAIKQNDNSSVYHQWLSTAYSVKMLAGGMMAQMSGAPAFKREIERAVALDSTNIDARVTVAQFYVQAPAMMGGGVDKARDEVAAITRLNPYQGKLVAASIAEAQKDTALAEQTLRDLAAVYPDSASSATRLSLFYANLKRYDDASATLTEFLARHPNDAGSLYQVGRLGAISGQHLDAAQTALHHYLKLPHHRGTPSLANAHWRLGMVLEAKGDKRSAKSEYETALRLDPNLSGARTSLDKLK